MDKRRSEKWTPGRGKCLARGALLSAILLAAGVKAEEKPLRQVDLLLLESHPSRITVGLYIELSPGWHLYWVNPGDAGLAPEVDWELPLGYEAGPLRYPVPEKIVHGEIVAYGFKNDVMIRCEIWPSGSLGSADPPPIACRLNWMACRESCVTGQEAIKISPAAQTPAALKKSREIQARFAGRYPGPLETAGISVQKAAFVQAGNGWRAEILLSGKDASRISDFYPYPIENFVVAHSRIAVDGRKLIIPLEPSSPGASLLRLDGLLLLGNDAYEASIPVKSNDPSS